MSVDIAAAPATVFEAFLKSAREFADHEFLVVPASACARYAEGSISFTYRQMLEAVEARRELYRISGFRPGMRVALLLENRPAYFINWFALNALGVSVVPINPDYRSSELAYLLSHSEAVMAVSLGERVGDLKSAAAATGLKMPILEEARFDEGLPPVSAAAGEPPPGRETECALLYTSGTTGRPKGCLLSNDYFLRMGDRYVNRGGYIKVERGRARVLTPLPLFHMNAMASTALGMIVAGGCIIQLDRFHPKSWWSDVSVTEATGIHYLGVMPALLLGLPATSAERSHRVQYGAGANVEPQHHAAFEERFGFPLIEAWAMTETGAGAAVGADVEPRHVGTRCFGKVPAAMELRLVDDAGNDVPAGQPGEMLVRAAGPDPKRGFFSGYLKDPSATAAGWTGGWWHSGDIARFGPDGSLHFVDRKKNVIRRSGENISALDVEVSLQQHPAIALVAVAPVADDLRGEEVAALIVVEPGQVPDRKLAETIMHWSLERQAYYKAPGWLAFVDQLPTTATQKLQRGALRDMATELIQGGKSFDLRDMKKRVLGPATQQ
jgi:acyl-CoA synthetase (AMP-forming)/AMP-acid ligase II